MRVTGSDLTDVAAYEQSLDKVVIGGAQPLQSRIEIHEYDPRWPALYAREAARLERVLGARAVRLEHAGSTAVPGLPAKPIVDIVLEVPDSSDEPGYLPDLQEAGYRLTIREPEWFEHRVFKGPDTNINLHVFSAGCTETERMLRFRDWLRSNDADRNLYARVKRELSARDWKYVQQYADAKNDIVAEIIARADAASV
jgi:GrpB-like predicted nucleotidyltransferase (UPF0157 family)